MFALTVACGTDTGGDSPGAKADAAVSDGAVSGADALPTDVTATAAFDAYACPGGHLCACASDVACLSGFCIEVAGQKRCAEPCKPECPDGLVCKPLDKGGVHLQRCVPRSPRLCEPCMASEACRGYGHGDALCVDHGAAGAFCGEGCQGDAQCPEGHACAMVTSVEGDRRLQCVPAPKPGAPAGTWGVCACPQSAIDKQLKTRCWLSSVQGGVVVGKCMGQRVCGASGLSDCDATPPAPEACNGLDDDCDGVTDEVSCDDGESCTVDACDPKRGAGAGQGCVHTPKEGACDADGSVCTEGDVCKAGKCTAGAAKKCEDGEICTVDACHPVLGCTFASDEGKSCDDGNACTTGDACAGGKCRPGTPKVCDDAKACTLDACDKTSGKCVHTLTKGLACDDGDDCTHTDLCDEAGTCKGKAVSCDDGNICTEDTCKSVKGQGKTCDHLSVAGGTACDDGDKCTGQGSCSGSSCTGAQPVVCTTNKVCTTAACNANTGTCEEKPIPNGGSCDDGDACTVGDVCQGNSCKGSAANCDDSKPCTTDSCDKALGCQHKTLADLSACSDGDACTESDLCVGGSCKGQKKVCDDKDACTVDACDPTKGCTTAPVKDGEACDDGDACSDKDTCKAGKCTAGANVCTCAGDGDCDDKNVCTTDKCDTGTKKCSHQDLTGACEDGDKCTEGDKCAVGGGKVSCVPGAKPDCDDGNTCTTDSCDPKTGCLHPAVSDGTGCDDGSLCTTTDTCKAGKCEAGTPVACTEYKACFLNACDPKTGKCAFTEQKAGDKCDDTDLCTTGTTCQLDAGVLACKGGTADKCVDGNECTKDGVCDKQKGCVHDPVSGACNDGDACTQGDACKDGKCNGQVQTCDDKDACTVDSCDKVKGCVTAPAKDGTGCDDGDKCTAGDKCTGGKCAGAPPTPSVSILAGSSKGHQDAVGKLAAFMVPWGLALDAKTGDLFVADGESHRIRQIKSDGTTTTLAGLGASGFMDGAAQIAQFWAPSDLTLDEAGNLWIADRGNHRVRKLASKLVSTLAGTAAPPPLGKDPVGGYAEGTGDKALFNLPSAIAWSKAWNGLVVADQGNHRVRLVAADGTSSLIAGSGTAGYKDGQKALAQFDTPAGVDVDANGVVYVGDRGNHRVRRIALDGTVTTVAGSGVAGFKDGTGTAAQFSEPWGVSLDSVGNLMVADSKNHRVRSVKLADGAVSTLAGTGVAGTDDGAALQALFNLPAGLVADALGNTWIADSLNARVRQLADPAKVCVPDVKPQ